MSVRFGFSVTPGAPLGVGEEMRRAEDLGYDRFGVWDSPALFREPWTTLASVARDTDRIRLGTWVTNPLSRHPLVTAACAATVDDLAPGRLYIGIGAGGTGVWHLGMSTAKLAELEAYVLAVRGLLETGSAEWQGHALTLPWAGPRRIPIIMGAHASRSLRLAGRIADGVVIGLGITPDVIASSLELLDAGARDGGRSAEDLEVWFTSFWWADEEPGKAKADGAWSATAFALHFADSGVEHKFLPEEFKAPLLEIGKAYDLKSHGHPSDEQKAEYVELADRLGVGPYLRERFMFAGTPDEVETQLRAAMNAGARNFDGAIDADQPEHERRITQLGAAGSAEIRGGAKRVIDLLITGGHVVTPFEEGELEIGISGETIAYVAPPGAVEADAGRVIDASGKLVFPGGVEPHAHIHEPMHKGWSQGREEWLQPPEGATRAALFGGTTTVVSFAFMDVHVEQQEFDANVAVEHRRRIFDPRSYADFAFHPVFTGTPSDATMASIADAVADGTATFKFFTTDLTTTPVRDPARQRLGANAARGVRAARRDGDGARRGRRPDQVHGGEAPARRADPARQRAPRAHEPSARSWRCARSRAWPRTRAQPSTSPTCAERKRWTRLPSGARQDSRSTARCCTTACASHSTTTRSPMAPSTTSAWV